MFKYTNEELDKFFDYLEASNDPFESVMKKKSGASKEVEFINKARARDISDAAIQAGLNIMAHDEKFQGNKKKRWQIDELINQLSDIKKTDEPKEGLSKEQIKDMGKNIAKDILQTHAEIKDQIDKVVRAPKAPNKKFIHEYNSKELDKIKYHIKKAWQYYNTAVKQGGYDGQLNTDGLPELIKSFAKHLDEIEHRYEMPGSIYTTIKYFNKLINEKTVWEEPDAPIKTPKDVDAYFAQLKESEKKQKPIISAYKKKTPEYQASKSIKSEGAQVTSEIKKVAEDIATKYAGKFSVDDKTIKELNKVADDLQKKKLSTGRTIETYYNKIEKSEDPISSIVAELIKHIKERRGKSKS